jgi:hypothetical protein
MILAKWGRCGRGAAVVLVAGVAAAALAAVLAVVAAARPLGFLHNRFNLSQTTTVAAYPDLAVSPDSDWVVAVWMEEHYQSGAGSYNHVYLRAASETGGGWGNEVAVFSGTVSTSAYDVAVAVTGTTPYAAHVAYVVFAFDQGHLTQTGVHHKSCNLNSSQVECDATEDVVVSVGASDGRIFWVDLALDASGNPHVVWAQYDADWNGDVKYRAHDGHGWGSTESVALAGNNHTPAIAWADGYAHVVWDEQTQHQIWYRRRAAWGWEPVVVPLCAPQAVRPPGNPDVAAGKGRVFVVWDSCSDPGRRSHGYCAQYNLVYRRLDGSGSRWPAEASDAREVGTDRAYGAGGLVDYDSAGWYIYGSDVRDEYLQYLRPSIALNDDGGPAVVWHADRSAEGDGEDYAIYYTYAITGGDSGVNWIPPAVLSRGQPTVLGSAVIGVGEPEPGGERYLHLAYMRRQSTGIWDAYYDSDEWEFYEQTYLPLVLKSP